MTDHDLQKAVEAELDFEPGVDAAHIGVAAQNGVITLTGHVETYFEKWMAEDAARRVHGVQGVAQEIEVRLPGHLTVDDDEIAHRALSVLGWRSGCRNVQVKVQKGMVTLFGDVDWYYQRAAAEQSILPMHGVTGIINNITVKNRASASDVRQKISEALKRNAATEASSIEVKVDGGRVTLKGNVHSWAERFAIKNAAWSAPGVSQVVDETKIAA